MFPRIDLLSPEASAHITIASSQPSKHEPLIQCCFSAGPASTTLAQQQNNT